MRRTPLVCATALLCLLMIGCSGSAQPNEIRIVAKLSPHPWFDRLSQGVTAAGTDLHITATMVGPPTATVQGQIDLIHQAITDHVDLIGIIPNDNAMLQPVMMEARAAGIAVITHESPDPTTPTTAAEWDIETIDNQRFAESAMDSLCTLVGGTGQIGHYVGGADLHRYWNTTARTHAQSSCPGVTFVSIETDGTSPTPCAEVADDCATATGSLLTMYPTLAGILAFGSQGAIGAGQYLMTNNVTTVAVVGVTVPSQAAALMQGGWIDHGVLWDPRDAGYALVAVGNIIAGGMQPSPGLSVGDLGAAVVNQDHGDVYFNRILDITPANVGTFTF